jgi:hypothetical protein
MIARRRYLAFVLLAALLASISSGAAAPAPAGKPLIADAGDSALLVADEPHLLGGMAWGGHAPYKYSWSFRGSASRFTRPKDPNSLFRTEGLKDGDYDLMVTVTDAAGSVARDTVRIRVIPVTRILEVKESAGVGLDDEDLGQSGAIDGQTKEFPFTIPAGVRRLDLKLSWGTYQGDPIGFTGVNDFDLYIEGPDPAYADNTGGAGGSMPERLGIDQPKPGAYKAIVSPFLTVPDEYELVVTMVKESGVNPIPTIELPSIYRFTAGKAQALQAKVKGASIAQAKWDADFDGRYETSGMKLKTRYGRGSHLATFKVISKAGFEVRKTVAVTIADADAIAANTSPFVVVGVGDTGINPYHEEFSADTYPDPEILRITRNFTRPPWEYIPGYPKGTSAIPITLGKGYWPDEDKDLWVRDKIGFQRLYWIPGTKIIGAVDWSDTAPINGAGDEFPIIDGDGHGTASASTAVGNRFGNCPACLLVMGEGTNSDEYLVAQSWIDIVSMSVGSVGNVGYTGPLQSATFPADKTPAERGQTDLYAAGNGFAGAFDVPMLTYTSSSAGPDWNVVVGAARTDNRRPVFGDANPVDISSWGDGTIPSACVTGVSTMCNHSGTSSATPLTSGVFGQVLREIRRALGDTDAGQQPNQVIAKGRPVQASAYLRDGILTRAELWDIVLHTAEPFGPAQAPVPPHSFTWPGPEDTDYLFGGYGLATPESALKAIDVALGKAPIPVRPTEDSFFELDAQLRNLFWGEWNSGTAGESSSSSARNMFAGVKPGQLTVPDGLISVMHERAVEQADISFEVIAKPVVPYWLHHTGGCPEFQLPSDPTGKINPEDTGNAFMDRTDTEGDDEPCPNARATTAVAWFRPVGIWASDKPVGKYLPAGSQVDATIYVTMEHPMLLEATGFLLAGGRTVGQGASPITPVVDVAAARCRLAIEGCWAEVPISFQTTRPVAAHELLTYQVALRTSENTYFGYEGDHASRVLISPAEGAAAVDLLAVISSIKDRANLHSGTTTVSGTAHFGEFGSESLRKVEVSVDDPSFASSVAATSNDRYAHWAAKFDLPPGQHTVYVRAVQDRRSSEADAVRVFASGSGGNIAPAPQPRDDLPATGVPGRGLFGIVLLAGAGCAALALRRRARFSKAG